MIRYPDNIDALLFDLGGVLIDVDFDNAFRTWGNYCGVPASVLRTRFNVDSFYKQHECGAIDASGYFQSLRTSLGIDLSDAEFTEGWNAILGEEIRKTTALLAQLKQRYPLYLFSNSNPLHHRCWATKFAPMLSHFQALFVSSDIGKRKPEHEAFLHVSSAIGIPPDRIMFFDDTVENIEGARRSGLTAVHVATTDNVANAVARLLQNR